MIMMMKVFSGTIALHQKDLFLKTLHIGCRFRILINEVNMSKKEFKLDEKFQFGLLRLKCVRANKPGYCNGCYFGSIDRCDVGEVGKR